MTQLLEQLFLLMRSIRNNVSIAFILAEPTRAPQDLKILWIEETSAKLSWKAIPCSHQNGMILRYLVRHDYELSNGTFATQQSETFLNSLETTLMNLRPNRKYDVKVAGVNEAGIGAFTLPIQLITQGGTYQEMYLHYVSSHVLKHDHAILFFLSLSLSRQSANHIS